MVPYIFSHLILFGSVVSWTTTSNHRISSFTSNLPHTSSSNLMMKSHDNSSTGNQEDSSLPSFKEEHLRSFLDAMSEVKSDTVNEEDGNWMRTEQDFKIYADLLREMETTGEDGIYSNILGDLNSSQENIIIPRADADADPPLADDEIMETERLSSNNVFDDVDGIGQTLGVVDDSTDLQNDVDSLSGTDVMMRRALQEALIEVRKNAPLNPASDPNSILNDKEMMKELNAIFDRANEKLLSSISEIRQEQESLSKATAEGRSLSLEAEERRLVEAEESVSRLVNKVRLETEEVEKALINLKDAQQKMTADPLFQAAGLKGGGIVKQGSLVGAFLFTFRSLGDLGSVVSSIGSPSSEDVASHGYAAAVQGLIALICAVYFKFL